MPGFDTNSNTGPQSPPPPQQATQPSVQVQTPEPSSTYATEVSHVIQGAGAPVKKRKPFKTFAIVLIALIIVSGLTGGGIYLYNLINNPMKVISDSFTNLDTASSFTANITFTKNQEFGDVSVMVDYHKAPFKYSRGQVKIEKISKKLGHNLILLIIFNSTDSFVQASYSEIDTIDSQINMLFPDIASFKTYQLIMPILRGQKWLHMKTPEDTQGYQEGEIVISEEQESRLNEKFIESIIVRSYERNYTEKGKKYQQIVLGFDKDKLTEFIQEFKSLDLDVELRQINSLIKIVQSVESWDEDLIEILAEKDSGNLYSFSVSFPKIPEDALERTIEESLKQEESIRQYYQLFSDKVTELIKPSDSSEPVYIGKVIFTNYNQAPNAQMPTATVEQEELASAFQEDLPIILQMALLQLQQPPQDQFQLLPEDYLTPTSPNTLGATDSASPTNKSFPQILEDFLF